jgi:hypothetical protein
MDKIFLIKTSNINKLSKWDIYWGKDLKTEKVELTQEDIGLLKSSLKFGKQVAEDWAKDKGLSINKNEMEVLLKKLEGL